MLNITSAMKIFLASGVTDMRKSFDTLAELVLNKLGRDPYAGDVFVFCNRQRNRLKVLVWEPSGFWLCAKRLEKGTFSWPQSAEASISLSPEELVLLLGGIDVEGTVRRKWYDRAAV